MRLNFCGIIFSLFMLACPLRATVTMPGIFSDNMVLQQNTSVKVWGTTTGSKVTLKPSWTEELTVNPIDGKGSWIAYLNTLPATHGESFSLEVFDDEGSVLMFKNIVFGEVWLCSGQSNMQMPMKGFKDQPVEDATRYIVMADVDVPIRVCEINRVSAPQPRNSCIASWKLNTPENVPGFSAVAYFFALRMQEILKVPVGVVVAAHGGARIEAFMKEELFQTEFKTYSLDHLNGAGFPHNKRHKLPSLLYNGMLAPIAGYSVKGMLWYQGESNREVFPDTYCDLQTAFVKAIREDWGQEDMPFYFVQIPPYNSGYDANQPRTAALREQQVMSLNTIPNSYMAVIMDAGSYDCVHAPKKQVVGDRLASLALQNEYGAEGYEAHAPIYSSMQIQGTSIYVAFEVGEASLAPLGKSLANFSVAGEDKVFYPASARVVGKNIVIVGTEQVPAPVAVRYCFDGTSVGTLFNNYGVPASPFRTDAWELVSTPNK